jgi:hypothetical protein
MSTGNLHLPPDARRVDPRLSSVGAGRDFQHLVYGRADATTAVVVARLLKEHPEGVVGRFYGTRLWGIPVDDAFVPWRTEPLGEMRWDDERGWVQVSACHS